ncbi:MAG: hypothetical protein IKR93_07170 [Firmicutes bacterium]|nr:hypothetical protein [Bacillota bacterium]
MAVQGSRVIKDRRLGMDQFPLRIAGLAGTFLIGLGSLFPGLAWMDGFRWFAFPIFAFLINEGYEKTLDRKLYARRLVIFAFLSEIPHDLLRSGRVLDYDGQNVLFTLLLGYLAIAALDYVRGMLENTFVTLLTAAALSWIGYNLGKAFSFEMYGIAVVLMLAFNIAGRVTYTKLMQFAVLMFFAYRNYAATLMQPSTDAPFAVPAPVFAMAALILIWLYNGERGLNTLKSRYVFYCIYPVMLLLLWLLKLMVK